LTRRDPLVVVTVEGTRLRVPLSHELPYYRDRHERYALNVAAMAALLSRTQRDATMVDIGANVGDTTAIVRSVVPAMPILCVEGNPGFAALLRYNLSGWPNIEIDAPRVLAEASGMIRGRLDANHGTARILGDTQAEVVASSLDDVLCRYPRFSSPALIKSDTDGFEARVMAGAANTLNRCHPALHLEYDPALLSACGSNGLDLLERLRAHDYGPAVVYDNLGHSVCVAELKNVRLFEDLHRYALGRADYYYDLAIFPSGAGSLADDLYRRGLKL
jgi:FkbM family methyltransferase